MDSNTGYYTSDLASINTILNIIIYLYGRHYVNETLQNKILCLVLFKSDSGRFISIYLASLRVNPSMLFPLILLIRSPSWN